MRDVITEDLFLEFMIYIFLHNTDIIIICYWPTHGDVELETLPPSSHAFILK